MNRVIIPVLILVATLCFTFALWISDPITQANRRQAAALRQYRQGVFTDIATGFLPFFLLVVLIAVLIWVVVLGVAAYRRYSSRDAIHADYDLERLRIQADVYKSYFDAQKQIPDFSGVQSVNWNPRTTDSHALSYTLHNKPQKPYLATQNAFNKDVIGVGEDSPIIQVPSFREALEDGTQSAFVLGYDDISQPVLGTLSNFYSLGVGGMSGSGKTSVTVWLIVQAVIRRAKLIVIDPHAGNPDSLATKLAPLREAYLCEVATTEVEMYHSISVARDMFERRKAGQGIQYPVIVVCDEWLTCMRGTFQDEFQRLAEAFTQEGRKYGVIGCFISHKWSIQKSGDMRDTLTSHIFTRTRANLARQQTGLSASELPKDIMSLEVGKFYLLSTLGEIQKLSAPLVTTSDLEYVANTILAPVAVTGRVNRGEVGHTQATTSQIPTIDIEAAILSPEHQRMIDMFKDEKSIRSIVKEVYGVSSGAKYNKYLAEVQDLIRSLL